MTKPAIPLYGYQTRWFKARPRFKCGMFSRQSGKTFTTSLEIVDDSFMKIAQGMRTRWIILSRGERQSVEAMREGVMPHCAAYGLATGSLNNYDWEGESGSVHKAFEIELPQGTRITALPANPDTARGFSGNVYLDEFAIHKDPRAIWGALFPVVSAKNYRLVITSTPKGKGNKFYELMTGNDQVWHRQITDIHQAVADGLPRNIAELKAGLNDQELWEQEYECLWLDEASSWLSFDLIMAVEDDEAGIPEAYLGGICFVGVDIAARKDLFVIWVMELVGDVLWTREIIAKRRISFAEQDFLLDDVFRRYRVGRCFMDQTGMGEKPVEDAKRRHGSERVVGVLMSGPRRMALATGGKQAFEDRTLRIPQGDMELRGDLHKLKKVPGENGAPPRLVADSTAEGHADRTWAGFLAIGAADGGEVVIDSESTGPRQGFDGVEAPLTDTGFGTVAGMQDFGGYA